MQVAACSAGSCDSAIYCLFPACVLDVALSCVSSDHLEQLLRYSATTCWRLAHPACSRSVEQQSILMITPVLPAFHSFCRVFLYYYLRQYRHESFSAHYYLQYLSLVMRMVKTQPFSQLMLRMVMRTYAVKLPLLRATTDCYCRLAVEPLP